MERIRSTHAVRYLGTLVANVSMSRAEYVFTSHGRPVALLMPVPEGFELEGIPESPVGQKPPAAPAK